MDFVRLPTLLLLSAICSVVLPCVKTKQPFYNLKIILKRFSHTLLLSWSVLRPPVLGHSYLQGLSGILTRERRGRFPRSSPRAGDGFLHGQTILSTTWKPVSFLVCVPDPSMPLLLSLYSLPAALLSQESAAKSWQLADSGLHLGSLLLSVIWLFHPRFAVTDSFWNFLIHLCS